MKVLVDDVWASPSTLHLRVTVSGDNYEWRRRFYEAVPLEDIPSEALETVITYWLGEETGKHQEDTPLF